MTTGKFVVFEGIENCGKSSQIIEIGRLLTEKKIPHFLTYEPTDRFRQIRAELSHSQGGLNGLDLQKLFIEDRARHLQADIIPAINQGKIVICDRYYHSTIVYGLIEGADFKSLLSIQKTRDFLKPDLTIWFRISPEEAQKRGSSSGKPKERFDNKLVELNTAYTNIFQFHQDDLPMSAVNASENKQNVKFQICRLLVDDNIVSNKLV